MKTIQFGIRYSMRKKHEFLDRILRAANLPQDLNPHLLTVRWIGGTNLIIEQHRGILTFEEDRISFKSEQGILCVEGETLQMEHLTDMCASITGNIKSVAIED